MSYRTGYQATAARANRIAHARIKIVGIYQSCMVSNGRFIPKFSYQGKAQAHMNMHNNILYVFDKM